MHLTGHFNSLSMECWSHSVAVYIIEPEGD